MDDTFSKPPTAATNLSFNYRACATEVIRLLRGDLSQRELSERLGYTFNQIGKWESGVTQIKWDDFILLCEKMNVPFESFFRQKFWMFAGEFSPAQALLELSKNLKLSPHQEKKYKHKLRAWETEKQTPDLAEVLEIIDLVPSMLIIFLEGIVDCEKVETLQNKYQTFMLCLELVNHDPICVYLNSALQIEAYKKLEYHDDEILAYHATCSVEHLKHLLARMLVLNIITFDGKKYLPCPFDFSFSGHRTAKLRSLTKYSTDLASQRYTLTPALPPRPGVERNPSVSSVRVNAMSEEAATKMLDLVSEFHNRVAQIVTEDRDKPKNNVQLVIIHSFSSIINSR